MKYHKFTNLFQLPLQSVHLRLQDNRFDGIVTATAQYIATISAKAHQSSVILDQTLAFLQIYRRNELVRLEQAK